MKLTGRFSVLAFVLAAIGSIFGGGTTTLAEGQRSLTELERQVAKEYSGVASLLPHQAHDLLRSGEPLLLLDVREAAEFEVSHLPGALLVDPDLSVDAFLARFGAGLAGRTILLYCSVGVRSSRLGARIMAAATARGAAGVYNIRGGIFAWHNYGKRLEQQKGRTDLVHPYSTRWSRYLDFPNHSSFGSRPSWW